MKQSEKPALSAGNKKFGEVAYFSMPLWRLALLSFFTGGIYNVYWFYKNWKSISVVRSEKIYPFWRAILNIFYVWPLSDEVLSSAKSCGFKPRYSSGLVAFAYVVCILAGMVLLSEAEEYNIWMSIGFAAASALGVIPLLVIQKAINFNNTHISLKVEPHRTSVPEVLLIVVSVLFFLLLMIGLFVPPEAYTPSPDQQTQIAKQQAIVDNLTAQYEKCSADLWDKKERVDELDPVAVDDYNADWDACEAVRLQQNEAVDAHKALVE